MRPEANRYAVTPLMAMPIAATTITVFPATGSGWNRRMALSHPIAPTAIKRKPALNSAARIELPWRP